MVLVHGFPSSKQGRGVVTAAIEFAKLGFFVVTYDVRGQGSALALNPGKGTTLMGLTEWIDMFEQMEAAIAAFPKLVDKSRIAVHGFSQGGAHAWAAAAYSGRTPPRNPRRTKPFPVVTAVVPWGMPPSHPEATTLHGAAFKDKWALYAYAPSLRTVAFDPAVKAVWAGFLDKDDPEGNAAWLRKDPGRDVLSLLATTKTAIQCTVFWLDAGGPVNDALKVLQSLPATTPWRVLVSTGGHGTPANQYEEARKAELRRAWLLRFLKGSKDPVEQGPPVLSAAMPADPSAYTSASSLWRVRADTSFPPAGVRTQTWYLRSGHRLRTSPPATAETPDRITHAVPAGYTARSWYLDGSGTRPQRILSKMPLSDQVYTSAPLATAIEIAGIPRVQLAVSPREGRFFLAARLEASLRAVARNSSPTAERA